MIQLPTLPSPVLCGMHHHHFPRNPTPFLLSQYLSQYIFSIAHQLSSFSSIFTRVSPLLLILQCGRSAE